MTGDALAAAAPSGPRARVDAGRLAFVVAVAAATLAAFLARVPALDVPSLWLDDEAAATLVRAAPAGWIVFGDALCAPGFILLERAACRLFGFGELQLQALPFAAGLALVPVGALLVRRVTASRAVGALAACAFAANVTVATYSLRVKPYSVEALATAILLLLAHRASLPGAARDRLRDLVALSAVALAAVPVALQSLLVGTVLVQVQCACRFLEARRARARVTPLVVLSAVSAVAMASAWILLVRGRGNANLVAFWAAFYAPIGDASLFARWATEIGVAHFTKAFPPGLAFAALLVPVGLARLLARRELRPLGLSMLLFHAAALAASALRIYPMGASRLDAYSHPITILAACFALVPAGALSRRLVTLAAIAATLAVAILLPRSPSTYPGSSSRQVVEHVAETLPDGDGLIVYPGSSYAFAIYGRWPARIVEDGFSTNGFRGGIDRPRTLVLSESVDGVSFLDDASVVASQIVPFLARPDAPERFVYSATHGEERPHAWIVRAIEASGYRLVRPETFPGAIVFWYVRAEGSDRETH